MATKIKNIQQEARTVAKIKAQEKQSRVRADKLTRDGLKLAETWQQDKDKARNVDKSSRVALADFLYTALVDQQVHAVTDSGKKDKKDKPILGVSESVYMSDFLLIESRYRSSAIALKQLGAIRNMCDTLGIDPKYIPTAGRVAVNLFSKLDKEIPSGDQLKKPTVHTCQESPTIQARLNLFVEARANGSHEIEASELACKALECNYSSVEDFEKGLEEDPEAIAEALAGSSKSRLEKAQQAKLTYEKNIKAGIESGEITRDILEAEIKLMRAVCSELLKEVKK
jgi:hypothetical protein